MEGYEETYEEDYEACCEVGSERRAMTRPVKDKAQGKALHDISLQGKSLQGKSLQGKAQGKLRSPRGQLFAHSCQRMRELADASIDLVVTSPPYWNDPQDEYLRPAAAHDASLAAGVEELEEEPQERTQTSPPQKLASKNLTTSDLPTRNLRNTHLTNATPTNATPTNAGLTTYAAFLKWLQDCLSECYRVLKPGRFCAVVVATSLAQGKMFPLPFHLVERLERIGFLFHQDILWQRWRGWDKRAGSFIQQPFPGYYYPNRCIEYVLVFRKPGPKLYEGRSLQEKQGSRFATNGLFALARGNRATQALLCSRRAGTRSLPGSGYSHALPVC